MGIAVGRKCPACGCGGVLVRYSPTREQLRYACSACDYVWIEKPLFLQEEKVPVRETWTLAREVAHLEYLVEAFSRHDWKHTRVCFRNSARRLRTLVDREPSRLALLDQLEKLIRWI